MTSIPTQPPERAQSEPDIPDLFFENRSHYTALHFDTMDQHDSAFHVVVAKIAYRLGPCDSLGEAALMELEEAAELNVEDRYNDDQLTGSVRQESDLAPYKPLCDVIVTGAAYAPPAKRMTRFHVALQVQAPDCAAPLPEQPQALNPLQGLSAAVYEAWQKELAAAQNARIPGAVLINKTLLIHGERHLRKRMWPVRLIQAALQLCSFGLVRLNPWRLTRPAPCTRVPLLYELAQGGECRVDAREKAARRVSKKHRLTPEQQRVHPDQQSPPIAHDACMRNPLGRGFARRWYLNATAVKQLPAPQIEYPAQAFSARRFWREANGKASLAIAGLGFVGRAWTPRRQLIGTIREKTEWAAEEFPRLPEEFDFRYWNGAPEDQQCPHLSGRERFTLSNLCEAGTPFSTTDAKGNTLIRFTLPQQMFFMLAATTDAQIGVHALHIDTVSIDAEAGRVDLVWRACLPADGDISGARLMYAKDQAQLQRVRELLSADNPDTGRAGT